MLALRRRRGRPRGLRRERPPLRLARSSATLSGARSSGALRDGPGERLETWPRMAAPAGGRHAAGAGAARRRASVGRRLLAPGDQGGSETERNQRYRRHLPVPVEPGVECPGGQRRGRSGGGARVPSPEPDTGGAHAADEEEEQRQPDEAQLGRGLEVERVCVARGVGPVGQLEPFDREAPGAGAGQRVVGECRRALRPSSGSGCSRWSGAGRVGTRGGRAALGLPLVGGGRDAHDDRDRDRRRRQQRGPRAHR